MSTPIGDAVGAFGTSAAGIKNDPDNDGNNTVNEESYRDTDGQEPTPIELLLSAQMKFIRAQTGYLHNRLDVARMCSEQETYIVALQNFLQSLGVV